MPFNLLIYASLEFLTVLLEAIILIKIIKNKHSFSKCQKVPVTAL